MQIASQSSAALQGTPYLLVGGASLNLNGSSKVSSDLLSTPSYLLAQAGPRLPTCTSTFLGLS